MPLAVEVEQLNFSYPDGTKVLEGLTFAIEEGSSVGLIGPNGAGKTTLLLHLNGILKGQGRIRIFGTEITQDSLFEIRRQVGLVFQDPDSQLFMPSVFDDVAFGPLNMGLDAQEVKRRVRGTLAAVDMQDSMERASHHLSFGEKKRVCVATVLAMEPRLLVLDEPTSNLDPGHRQQLIQILKDVPVTKLIASHDLDMIQSLTEKVILLTHGQMAAYGPTKQILMDRESLKRHGFTFLS
ncbi:MAG: ATP-binding cassette domain-containing protein [Candidatus Omnitrophota bacterium]